jgi:allantoinase
VILRGRRVVTAEGVHPASIQIEGSRITRVAPWDDLPAGAELLDAGSLLVMPGLVDSHVHVNQPGRTEWEGFSTATRAAAAGGITTLCDMPLNSIPPTTSVAGLEAKRAAAQGQCAVTVEFIGGVVPGNTADLQPLRDAGVCAWKCFLTPSGVPEFPHVAEADLRQAFPVLARLGRTLMVHAEDPALLHPAGKSVHYADYLASRPPEAERSAIELLIHLMEWCPTPVHIVHLSSARSMGLIRTARAKGLPLTGETCPHYLTFAAEEIPDGAVEYKCAPPIRGRAEREGLWEGLISGEIDLVASDHSPCPPAMKETGGDFFAAWGGIASLQVALPAVWTGARARGLAPERLAEWMSAAPARIAGLSGSKGALAAGCDADIVVWDPERSFVVDPATLLHRHKVTPYARRELYGVVRATIAGGRVVFGSL